MLYTGTDDLDASASGGRAAERRESSPGLPFLGITEQTYYRWWKAYGGVKIDQARRLRELERENARLRRTVADLTLIS